MLETLCKEGRVFERLYRLQEGEDIPRRDRGWFWKTFKALKGSGLHYEKAWHFTVLALEHHYLLGERRVA